MAVTDKKIELSGWGNFPRLDCAVNTPLDRATAARVLTNGKPLTPRGLGRSYADQAIGAHSLVLDATRLNRFINFDEDTGVLEAEAGLSLDEIIRVMAPRGWFPMVVPGTKYVTLGGAIANDIHGKAHHVDGSFARSVLSFTVLLASGEVVTASPETHEDLFWASFGGLGLLGVILTVRLRLRRIETVYFKQKNFACANLEDMMDAIDEADSQYRYTVAWVDPLASGTSLGKGVLTAGNPAAIADLPKAQQAEPLRVPPASLLQLPFYMPDFALNRLSVGVLNRVIEKKQRSPREIVHYNPFFFPLDAIGGWNKGYGRRGFVQYQFLLPEADARPRVRYLLKRIAESGQTPFLNVLKKFGEGESRAPLSFPFRGYTLAVDFPVRRGLFRFLRSLDHRVAEFDGRIYLGKDACLSADLFRQMYPQYEAWRAVKTQYDPDNRFVSALSERLAI